MRQLLCLLVLCFITSVGAAQDFVDGTVIVWENGNYLNLIQQQTGSNFTHVGIILYEGKQAWVYEASKPDVHRYTWEQYDKRVREQKKSLPKLQVHFLPPSKPYTETELASMKSYANKCLGFPFGVKSYLSGKRTNTMHCCEYVGNILASSGRYQTLGPKENPKTIYERASKL